MSRSTELEIAPQSATEYKAAFEKFIEEMERSRERMSKDQLEVDKLREETREILDGLKLI